MSKHKTSSKKGKNKKKKGKKLPRTTQRTGKTKKNRHATKVKYKKKTSAKKGERANDKQQRNRLSKLESNTKKATQNRNGTPTRVTIGKAGSTDQLSVSWSMNGYTESMIDGFDVLVEVYNSKERIWWNNDVASVAANVKVTRAKLDRDHRNPTYGKYTCFVSVDEKWERVAVRVRARAKDKTYRFKYTDYSVQNRMGNVKHKYKQGKKKGKTYTKREKVGYKLVAKTKTQERTYYYFGDGDGVSPWSGYAAWDVPESYFNPKHQPHFSGKKSKKTSPKSWRYNPAWESAASDARKEQESKDNEKYGDPSEPSISAEYRLGYWNVTWTYPDADEPKLEKSVLEKSFDGGYNWDKLGEWELGKNRDDWRHTFSDPGTPGGSAIYRVTIKTRNGSADAQTDSLDDIPLAPIISGVEATSEKTATVYFDTEGDAGDTAEIYYSPIADYVAFPDNNDQRKAVTFDYACADGSSSYSVGNIEETGALYFSMRLKSSAGYSDVSNYASIAVGTTATAPTPTFDRGTVVKGEVPRLTWVHNDADGSAQSAFHLKASWTMYDDSGSVSQSGTILDTDFTGDDGLDSYYDLDVSSVPSGATVQWSVATAGANEQIGEACATQQFDVYVRPTLSVSLYGGTDSDGAQAPGVSDDQPLTQLPLQIDASQSDPMQEAVEWTFRITVAETVVLQDLYGNDTILNAGTEIYRDRLTDGENYGTQSCYEYIDALDADWPDGASLVLTVGALMNTGISAAESTFSFSTDFSDREVTVMATVDRADNYRAVVIPQANDNDGNLAQNVTLSVYRQDADGGFTTVAEGMPNNGAVVFDDYPNFGQCTYRIVANDSETDRMFSVDETLDMDVGIILIQWGEPSVSSEADDGSTEVTAVSANWVELPWNIKISEKREKDVSLKKYIGRSHEVSYYGTLVTDTGSWSADIIKGVNTFELEQLRALGEYMGDVYVREPSGLGYWAHVDVSEISTSYDTVRQGVTLSVTRVEG